MKTRKLDICRLIISITLTVVVAWSVLVGNSIFVIFAILTVFAVTVFLRRKDERLRVDEQNQLINEKALMQTVRIFMLGTTVVGAVMVALVTVAIPIFLLWDSLYFIQCGL